MNTIREVIEQIVQEKLVIAIRQGKVTAIEGDTCTVLMDEDEREFFEVTLSAVQLNAEDKLLVTPKMGSKVIVGVLPDGEDAALLAHSEVESLYYKNGTTECLVNAEGYQVERDGENLLEVLNEFIDEVNKIIVVNGTTINKAAVTAIKARLNKILN